MDRALRAALDPRAASCETPWEDVHVADFSGEALWTYLTVPFLYTYPGFVTEELTPCEENGEQWRRLKAIFPANISSHTREQISYFGPDGLLRRHVYAVDILGGATGAIVERQGRYLARLIDQVMELGRRSHNKTVLCKEWFDLGAIIMEAVEAVQPRLVDRRHRLTVTLPPDSLYVLADALQMRQVVTNLLANAAK